MTKVTLTNLASLQNEASAINIINTNNDAIEAAIENTLSRDGTTPNQMTAELDMNSQRILNLPQPLTDAEPARLADLEEIIGSTGDGNVLGPASSVGGNIAVFSGTTGKMLADGGASIASKANVTSPTISNPTFTGTVTSGEITATKNGDYARPLVLNNNAATSADFIQFNTAITGGDKFFRVDSLGNLQVIDSGYTQAILNLSNVGVLTASSFLGDGTTLTGVETAAHAAATYSPITRTFNTQTGTTYTLVLADSGKVVLTTSASPVTVTIPPNSSEAFPLLTQIDFLQYGTGKLTLAQGSGVTIQSNLSMKSIAGQYQAATLLKISTNNWVLFGALSA